MGGFFNAAGPQFSSTIGAFIGGAARAGTEQIFADEDKKYQDQVSQQKWLAKVDQGIQARNKENRALSDQANVYKSTILPAVKGNEQLADTYFNMYKANPKILTPEFLESMQKSAEQSSPDPAYKSSVLPGLTSSAAANHSNSQADIQHLGNYGQYATSPVNPLAAQQQPTQAQPTQSATAPTIPTQSTPAGQPAVTPDTGDPTFRNLPPQAANAPSYLSTDNTPGQTPAAPPGIPPTQQAAQNTPLPANGSPTTPQPVTPGTMKIVPTQKPMTPYQAADLELKKNADARAAAAANNPTKTTYAPIEASDKDFLDNPKYGIHVLVDNLKNNSAQNWNTNLMIDTLSRGFNASKIQDAVDEFARFVKPAFGMDVTQFLGANPPNSVNEFRKARSAALLNQLQTYHFGRILQMEVQKAEQSLPNSGSDPNTNAKIVLLMQAGNQMQREGVLKAADIANKATDHSGIAQARQVMLDVQKAHENDHLPWQQATPDNFQRVTAGMQPGQWVENTKTGMMYQVVGNDNGQVQLRKPGGQ